LLSVGVLGLWFVSFLQDLADVSWAELALESEVSAASPELQGLWAQVGHLLYLLGDGTCCFELGLGLECALDSLAKILKWHDLLGLQHELLGEHREELTHRVERRLGSRSLPRCLLGSVAFFVGEALLLD
jgi:hypothetical protein